MSASFGALVPAAERGSQSSPERPSIERPEGDRFMKARFLVTCAAAALLSGFAAGASYAADATAAADASGAPVQAVQEIVVTAQRRDETIQNVPMTVQAISTDAIEKLNITDIEQVLRFTPNVVYSAPGAGQGQLSM